MGFNPFSKDTAAAQIEAIHRSQAVIEFDVAGTVLFANNHFLSTTAYQLAEVVGVCGDMSSRLAEELSRFNEAWRS